MMYDAAHSAPATFQVHPASQPNSVNSDIWDEFITLLVKLGVVPLKESKEATEDKATEETQPADPASP